MARPHGHALSASPKHDPPKQPVPGPRCASTGQDIRLLWARDTEPGDAWKATAARVCDVGSTGPCSVRPQAFGPDTRTWPVGARDRPASLPLTNLLTSFSGGGSATSGPASPERGQIAAFAGFRGRGWNGRAQTRGLSVLEIRFGRSGRRAADISEADGDPRQLSPHPRGPEMGTHVLSLSGRHQLR